MAPGVMETTVTVGGQAGGRGLLLRKFAIRYPLGSGWLMLGWRGLELRGAGGATRPPRPTDLQFQAHACLGRLSASTRALGEVKN